MIWRITDVVQLTAIAVCGTTFQWTLVFVPEGSTAVLIPPADCCDDGWPTCTFTVDKVGPYLVRLVVDAGLADREHSVCTASVRFHLFCWVFI